MRPGGGFGVLCSFVHRTVEGHLVVLIVVDVADVPEGEEEEQSDAIGCTGLRAGRTWRELRGPRQGMDAARATMVEVNRSRDVEARAKSRTQVTTFSERALGEYSAYSANSRVPAYITPPFRKFNPLKLGAW